MSERHPFVIPMVVGSIAAIAILCVLTMCISAFRCQPAGSEVKEMAIASLAALTALLARTSSNISPAKVEVANPPSNPVPVKESDSDKK